VCDDVRLRLQAQGGVLMSLEIWGGCMGGSSSRQGSSSSSSSSSTEIWEACRAE
jgi:hypothetical protein